MARINHLERQADELVHRQRVEAETAVAKLQSDADARIDQVKAEADRLIERIKSEADVVGARRAEVRMSSLQSPSIGKRWTAT